MRASGAALRGLRHGLRSPLPVWGWVRDLDEHLRVPNSGKPLVSERRTARNRDSPDHASDVWVIPAVSGGLRLGNPGSDVDLLLPSAPCVRSLAGRAPRLVARPRAIDEVHLSPLHSRASGSAGDIDHPKLPRLA